MDLSAPGLKANYRRQQAQKRRRASMDQQAQKIATGLRVKRKARLGGSPTV